METTQNKPFLSDVWYNRLKWVAQIFLPAVAALYFSLGEIWGLPKPGEVVGTITVIDFFLGTLLGISTKAYNRSDARFDGTLTVQSEEGVPVRMEAELNELENPMDLADKDEVVFKVSKDNLAS